MSSIDEKIEENMYYNMFQSCTKLTRCPDFGGGKEEKEEKENELMPEVKKIDDFNWDDNMNEAYRE